MRMFLGLPAHIQPGPQFLRQPQLQPEHEFPWDIHTFSVISHETRRHHAQAQTRNTAPPDANSHRPTNEKAQTRVSLQTRKPQTRSKRELVPPYKRETANEKAKRACAPALCTSRLTIVSSPTLASDAGSIQHPAYGLSSCRRAAHGQPN